MHTFPIKPLGVITTIADLRRLLNARRIQLGFTMLALDAHSGLQDGYSGKLLSVNGSRNFGVMSFEVM
jgi:hypothetical protein